MTELEERNLLAKTELLIKLVANLNERISRLEAAKEASEIWDWLKMRPDEVEES